MGPRLATPVLWTLVGFALVIASFAAAGWGGGWAAASPVVEQGESAVSEVPILALAPNTPVEGELHADSSQLDDGSYADLYALTGQAGQIVTVRLESSDFDAYLILRDRYFEHLAEDDDSAGGTDALLYYILPYTGTYYVTVTSFWPSETGRYTLSLGVTEDWVDAPVDEDLDPASAYEDLQVDLFWAAILAVDAISTGELQTAEQILVDTLESLRQHLPFGIARALLVTDPPGGYGMYTRREDNRYAPNAPMLIYVEPEYYGSSFDGRLHRFSFAVDALLVRPDGTVVLELEDVLDWDVVSFHRNREIYFQLELTAIDVPAGRYTWRLIVRDRIGGGSASVEVPVFIRPW